MKAAKDLPFRDRPESRGRASPIWNSWIGGVLLLVGAGLTPVWLGLLGWLGYELALAAAGIHG
jgi:hypothetical protein